MDGVRRTAGIVALALAITARPVFAQDCGCQSFGVDFLDGGSYFQDSLSSENFNATQEFEGCDTDVSNNILVDPNGDQYECGTTPITPDDTPQTFSCPVAKDELETGDYSIVIISNDGDSCPIAYQRNFYLSVGPQSTITVAPTLTISTTSTPVQSETMTSTELITSEAEAKTTYVPAWNIIPVLTINPLPAVTVVTKALVTLTQTNEAQNVVATQTSQVTASCSEPAQRRLVADPLNQILITVLSDLGLAKRTAEPALPAPTGGRSPSLEYKRALIEGRAISSDVKGKFIKERREQLALNKRAPDEPTVTITDGPASTLTSSFTAPITTITGTTTAFSTVTVTPTVTKKWGIFWGGIDITTASQQTLTQTLYVPATTVYTSVTVDATVTVVSTTTPVSLAEACQSVGGKIV